MKLLEENYEINFSKVNFLERKTKIENKKTIICGASKVGKSYLVYDFLSNFKSEEYLYIDFFDLRNSNIDKELSLLDDFISLKDIKVLVLENFNNQCKIPNCENIILTSQKSIEYKNFKKIELFALDFEEYLLFDNKHQNITQSFNNFLKYGNLPLSINTEEHKKISKMQDIIKMNSKDDTSYEILKILIENIDETIELIKKVNKKFQEKHEDKIRGDIKVLGVNSLNSSGVTIRVIGMAVPLSQWEMERELRKEIKIELDNVGIEIPYPKTKIIKND